MGCACLRQSDIIESRYIKKINNYNDNDNNDINKYITKSNREHHPKKFNEEFINSSINDISDESINKIRNEDAKTLWSSLNKKNESKITNCESPLRFISTKKNNEQSKNDPLKDEAKKAGPIISLLERKITLHKNKLKPKF